MKKTLAWPHPGYMCYIVLDMRYVLESIKIDDRNQKQGPAVMRPSWRKNWLSRADGSLNLWENLDCMKTQTSDTHKTIQNIPKAKTKCFHD